MCICHVCVQEHETSVYGSMKSLTAYFGEDWDANDPSRVLRVIRDFMNLFNKAHHEIEVWHPPHSQHSMPCSMTNSHQYFPFQMLTMMASYHNISVMSM